jgi:hypothetical protein
VRNHKRDQCKIETSDHHVISKRISIAAHTHQSLDNYCYCCYWCISANHYGRTCPCWKQKTEGY